MNSCPNCRIGRLHEVTLTYYRFFEGRTLIAPYAPANRCHVCRFVEYDHEFLQMISQMVETKKSSQRSHSVMANHLSFQQYYSHDENIKMI
jgi:hypothetical protein